MLLTPPYSCYDTEENSITDSFYNPWDGKLTEWLAELHAEKDSIKNGFSIDTILFPSNPATYVKL